MFARGGSNAAVQGLLDDHLRGARLPVEGKSPRGCGLSAWRMGSEEWGLKKGHGGLVGGTVEKGVTAVWRRPGEGVGG